MTFLDRVAARASTPRSEISRADPVSLEEFGYLLGRGRGDTIRTKAGATVGPRRALGITAWYSGVRYLAESVAGLPWHHYMRLGDSQRERRAPQSWLEKPDVEQTWYGFVESSMMSLLHKGNAYAFKIRNEIGQVRGLREIFADRVTVGIAPDGTKRFMVDRDETPYTTREILHIPGLAYDGRVGLNPIQAMADSLGGVAAADDYSARWFGESTHLGGIITVPQKLDKKQAGELRDIWDSFHQGLINAHKTGVLSAGATYNRVSLSASDAQLLEARQYGIGEISRMLRITPHKLYDLTHATFSNIEHLEIDAANDSIKPWVIRFESAINADPDLILPGHYLEASIEGLLRGDSAARAAYLGASITGGWMMPSTAAKLENLPSGPELDYYLRPLNMAVIRLGDDEATAAPTPEDQTEGAAA